MEQTRLIENLARVNGHQGCRENLLVKPVVHEHIRLFCVLCPVARRSSVCVNCYN